MRIRKALIAPLVVAALVLAGAVVAVVDGGGGRGGDDASTAGVAGGVPATTAASAFAGPEAAVAEDRAATGAADGDASTVDEGANSGAGNGASGLGGLPTPVLRTEVVKTATVSLEVGRREGRETVNEVIDAVGLVRGFVESTDQSGQAARLTVRVPASEFERTLDRLQALGKERDLEIHGQDVTGAVTDLDARLRNLRAQEAVLLELMGRATSVGDSIAVQQQLSQNQEQIEQLEGQRRVLAEQTSYATIVVSITAKGAPVPADPAREGGLAAAWDDALDAAAAVTGGMLVVVGALLPFLVLGGAGLLVWRLVVRHRRRVPAAPATG
jgi:hypothetical protein